MIAAEWQAMFPPVASPAWLLLGVLICFRLLQRLYYISKGHNHHVSFSPRAAFQHVWTRNSVERTDCHTTSSLDGVELHYQRIGSGPKIILHSNGVGTDFFIWLFFIQHLLKLDHHFFDKYTIIAVTHRGLFAADQAGSSRRVNITLENCAADVQDVMRHAGVQKLETFIGWSTGAQVGLACCLLFPDIATGLFLFNTSLGSTLHGVFQPVMRLPAWIQCRVSSLIKLAILRVRPVVDSPIWDALKVVAHSTALRALFEVLTFLNGFPPEQPLFFQEYARDIFVSRSHTHALLDLILMVDEPLPGGGDLQKGGLRGLSECVLLSGYFDCITGVYATQQLYHALTGGSDNTGHGAAQNSDEPTRCKHVVFTMGSHFLLLEWPEVAAKEFLAHLRNLNEPGSVGEGHQSGSNVDSAARGAGSSRGRVVGRARSRSRGGRKGWESS